MAENDELPNGGLFAGLIPAGTAAYSLYDQYDSLNQTKQNTQDTLSATANQINSNTAFTPYGVTGSLGSADSTSDGLNMNLNPTGQGIQDNMFSMGQQQLGASTASPFDRQNQLYQAMAVGQNPELERQRAQMNQTLRNSGRSGMTSQAYGGTSEQLAFEKARQEQQTANWLGAGTQANTELQNMYTRGIGMMDQGYKPMDTLSGYGDQNLTATQLNDARGTTRAGMLSDLALGGLNTYTNIENMKGRALADANTATQGMQTAAGSWLDNAYESGMLGEIGSDLWNGAQNFYNTGMDYYNSTFGNYENVSGFVGPPTPSDLL